MDKFKINKILLILFILFLFSCSKSRCNSEECVRTDIYCEENKLINITYACVDDDCLPFTNKSVDCELLDESSCVNKSIMHLISNECINAQCVKTAKKINCKPQNCINNKLNLYFYEATLDVSANDYTISIAGNWYNTTTGSFICREGDVIFEKRDVPYM